MFDLVLAVLVAAFCVTVIATKLLVSSALKKGVTDRDANKPGKPVVAAMGGFAVFGGYGCGLSK